MSGRANLSVASSVEDAAPEPMRPRPHQHQRRPWLSTVTALRAAPGPMMQRWPLGPAAGEAPAGEEQPHLSTPGRVACRARIDAARRQRHDSKARATADLPLSIPSRREKKRRQPPPSPPDNRKTSAETFPLR